MYHPYSEIGWHLGRNAWVCDYSTKSARIKQNEEEFQGLELDIPMKNV